MVTQTLRDAEALASQVAQGDRLALARAITLVESANFNDRGLAEALLTRLLPKTGNALRIGVSGAPGAGKSTFIEALGRRVTGEGALLAVLAIDPSSLRSGGSILGDKTRMPELARNPRAFIRPTAAGEAAGGVARRTREAMLLAEAAGYGVVIVETVGVGQSETAVSEMVDLFVLLVAPGSGDDLQGLKRGAMELADFVVVTKADGDLAMAAKRAMADYRMALSLLRPKHAALPPRIVSVSAQTGAGIEHAWSAMQAYVGDLRAGGRLAPLREAQLRRWLWREIRAALLDSLASEPGIAAEAAALEKAVVAGRQLPEAAARALIGAFRRVDEAKPPP